MVGGYGGDRAVNRGMKFATGKSWAEVEKDFKNGDALKFAEAKINPKDVGDIYKFVDTPFLNAQGKEETIKDLDQAITISQLEGRFGGIEDDGELVEALRSSYPRFNEPTAQNFANAIRAYSNSKNTKGIDQMYEASSEEANNVVVDNIPPTSNPMANSTVVNETESGSTNIDEETRRQVNENKKDIRNLKKEMVENGVEKKGSPILKVKIKAKFDEFGIVINKITVMHI